MRIPDLKRFNEGDFPGAPSWFPTFIGTLNTFMEQVVLILDRNTSIGENVTGRYFATSFKTRTDYATGGFNPINISWPFSVKPNAVLVVQVLKTDGTLILNPVSLQWIFGSNGISVKYVAGLDAATNYTINFLCL